MREEDKTGKIRNPFIYMISVDLGIQLGRKVLFRWFARIRNKLPNRSQRQVVRHRFHSLRWKFKRKSRLPSILYEHSKATKKHLNLLEKNSKPPFTRFRWLYWHPHFAKMVFPLNCVSLLKCNRLEETGILVHNQPRFRFTYSCKTHICHPAPFKLKVTDLSSLFGPAPAHDDTLITLDDVLSSLVEVFITVTMALSCFIAWRPF